MSAVEAVPAPSADPMLPRPFRITRTRKELPDSYTMELVPDDGAKEFSFTPGQFNMIYMFGVGEVPISISGDPADPTKLVHTIRAVGKVTEAMRTLKPGDTVGIRGPFGTGWPVHDMDGRDVVFITGGLGLAPLRPAIYHVLANRRKYGKVVILYGSRTPADLLYRGELEKWRGQFDLQVEVTVDRADDQWQGPVGVVPNLIKEVRFDPFDTTALVCGPEIMMRYTVRGLTDLGVTKDNIFVSMERNMKCAVGFCGHCQLGPTFVCRHGPVFAFDKIENLFTIQEL